MPASEVRDEVTTVEQVHRRRRAPQREVPARPRRRFVWVQLRPNHRRDAIRADQDVPGDRRTVGQPQHDAVIVTFEPDRLAARRRSRPLRRPAAEPLCSTGRMTTGRHVAGGQLVAIRGPGGAARGRRPAGSPPSTGRPSTPTSSPAWRPAAGRPRRRRAAQRTNRVRCQTQREAELARCRGLFEEADVPSGTLQREPGGEPSDPGADDQGVSRTPESQIRTPQLTPDPDPASVSALKFDVAAS